MRARAKDVFPAPEGAETVKSFPVFNLDLPEARATMLAALLAAGL